MDKNIPDLPAKNDNVISTEKVIVVSGGVVKLALASKFKGDPGESIQGTPGTNGTDGKSAYQLWLDAGNTGSTNVFLQSLIGDNGASAYELWISAGNTGSLGDFLSSLAGSDGKSAYQLWIQDGNSGTVTDFLNSLIGVGTPGTPGQDGATFDYRGDYEVGASYDTGDVVLFLGEGYVCRTDGNTNDPTDVNTWGKISTKGEDGQGGDMFKTANLSGLSDYAVARLNLDVYSTGDTDTAISTALGAYYTKTASDAKYALIGHDHSGVYEPVFTKNSAFNKNFGTTAGSVLEGNKDATYEKISNKGVANGYAPLDGSGLISSGYLPAFVDDVVEVADFASLPGSGESGKLYVTIDSGKTYRWGGSSYSEISSNNMSDAQATTLTNGSNADSLHIHTIAGITGLQAGLDGKANLSGGNTISGTQIHTGQLNVASRIEINKTAGEFLIGINDGSTHTLGFGNLTAVTIKRVSNSLHFETYTDTLFKRQGATQATIDASGNFNVASLGTAGSPAISVGVTTQGIFDGGVNLLSFSVGAGTHAFDLTPGGIMIRGGTHARTYYYPTGQYWEVKVASTDTYQILRGTTVCTTINNAGNLGVNVSSPTSAKLEVYSDLNVLGSKITGYGSTALHLSQSSTLGGATNYFEPDHPTLILQRASSSRGSCLAIGRTTLYSYIYSSGSTLQFYTNGNTSLNAMKIDSSGRVGIGLDTVASKFHLYQNDAEIGGGAGLTIEQAGTGDAVIQFLLTGVTRWVAGIDNSDANTFKISPSADVGATARFSITTGGVVEFAEHTITPFYGPRYQLTGATHSYKWNTQGGSQIMSLTDSRKIWMYLTTAVGTSGELYKDANGFVKIVA